MTQQWCSTVAPVFPHRSVICDLFRLVPAKNIARSWAGGGGLLPLPSPRCIAASSQSSRTYPAPFLARDSAASMPRLASRDIDSSGTHCPLPVSSPVGSEYVVTNVGALHLRQQAQLLRGIVIIANLQCRQLEGEITEPTILHSGKDHNVPRGRTHAASCWHAAGQACPTPPRSPRWGRPSEHACFNQCFGWSYLTTSE